MFYDAMLREKKKHFHPPSRVMLVGGNAWKVTTGTRATGETTWNYVHLVERNKQQLYFRN